MLKKNIYNNTILYLVNFLIIATPFLLYRHVDYFRINQELWVQSISFFILFLVLLRIINAESINLSKDKLSSLLIVFFIYISVSLLYSSSRLLSLRALLIFFCYIFLYLVIVNLNIRIKTEIIINVFIISASIIALYVICHYYGLITYLAMYGQIFSPIGQKNWASNFLSLALPSALVFHLLEKIKIKKIFCFVAIIIIYTALIICQSRGIWISVLLTIPIALILIKISNLIRIFKDNKKYLIALLLSIILITAIYSTDNSLNQSCLTVPQKAVSLVNKEDYSINMRLIMLNSTLKMIVQKPLFGFGFGTFNLNYPEYQGRYLNKNPGMVKYLSNTNVAEAHNEYIQFASEIGIIGLLIFLIIIFFFYKNSWGLLRAKNLRKENKLIYLGMFLGINIFLIHCLFTFPLHVAFLGASFFIMLGLANYIYIDNLKEHSIFKIHISLRKSIKIFSIIGLCAIFLLTSYLYIIKPYIAEIYSFRGQEAYVVDNDLNDSIIYFEKAAELAPYNGRILLHLGSVYLKSNYLAESYAILKQAKNYYNDRSLYYNLANNLRRSGNIKKAYDMYHEAVYLYPNYLLAYDELATLYVHNEEYEKAIEQWETALLLNPNIKDKYLYLYYIGMSYQRMENRIKAGEYFQKAIQEAPEDSWIFTTIENLLLEYNLNNNNQE